jgi:L-ascorbate metabolism protein UlaG (beta-lactamase superfamily)
MIAAVARALLLLLTVAGCGGLPRYPSSAQWCGDRFCNPTTWPKRLGVAGVIKWRLAPDRRRPEPFTAPFLKNDGTRVRANSHGPRASITWIGHATLLVQAGGVNVLTDPVFSDDVGALFPRLAPPGIALGDLPPIDVVLISHNHRDHLDEESVLALGPSVHYVVGLGLGRWFTQRGLTKVTELDWWQSADIAGRRGGTVHVTMVPSQHWSQRLADDQDRTLWGGYVVDGGGQRFYFAGDTGYPAAFAEIGRRLPGITFALLPIGAYAPRWFMRASHMSPDEAALAFRALGARWLVPMHWATFRLSDEPMAEPPELLYKAMGALKNRILYLPIGGSWFEPG